MTLDQWLSVGRGALVAVSGAALAALAQYAAATDLGPVWGPLLGAALAVLTNVVRKYQESRSGKVT